MSWMSLICLECRKSSRQALFCLDQLVFALFTPTGLKYPSPSRFHLRLHVVDFLVDGREVIVFVALNPHFPVSVTLSSLAVHVITTEGTLSFRSYFLGLLFGFQCFLFKSSVGGFFSFLVGERPFCLSWLISVTLIFFVFHCFQ